MIPRTGGRLASAVCALVACTFVTCRAFAEEPSPQKIKPSFGWLDYARGVPRAWSASRDTPRMEMGIFPRPVTTAGGEFAVFRLRSPGWTLRSGFAGFIELDNKKKTDGVNSGPLASAPGRILWRGAYAYYAALELPRLGQRVCSQCEFELALSYRHESEHVTASTYGGESEDYSDQPYVGDDVIADVAMAQTFGELYVSERVSGMWFLPDRSSYSAGAAVDLHARWMGWDALHPFVSGYAESLFGEEFRSRAFGDVYRLRVLLGVALPSRLGDVMFFGFGDVGNRYGLQAHTEEATLGAGVRLALGRSWAFE